MPSREVLSIGHSNHPIERFLRLLAEHAVTAVVDVRSVPYSRRNPAYNKESLQASLQDAGIAYLFLGSELGAKSQDPADYAEGRVQYSRLAEKPEFKDGLQRVIERSLTQRLALMCAEKEPLACHRTLLVARELAARGVTVAHIHADGGLEPHTDALRRLRALVGVPELDLLRTQTELDDEACSLQEQRIAYVKPPTLASPESSA